MDDVLGEGLIRPILYISLFAIAATAAIAAAVVLCF